MNGLKEIYEYIKNFICEKGKAQQQISEIEEKRTQLAQVRNEKKKSNGDWSEINELGRQICELGNQSQGLQNELDLKFNVVKEQANLMIDNLVAEDIRKIRIINEEIQELEEKTTLENTTLKQHAKQIEDEISVLGAMKQNIKSGNWNAIIKKEDEEGALDIEELKIEELEPIEEFSVEDFGQVEKLYVEEFQPIEEIQIEEFEPLEDVQIEEIQIEKFKEENQFVKPETIEATENEPLDEIEKLARQIVEEIAAEQTKDLNINKIEEQQVEETEQEDIITFEGKNKENVIIPLFGQTQTILNITVKIEDGELVYKALMSDDKEVKIYPTKIGEENVLLRDKQNREECKEILMNYSISEYQMFDKKVVNKIDPLVCELLIECAERYGYNAPELIYNYAMSFSYNVEIDRELVPTIVYNLSYLEQSNLSSKEKSIIRRICKNAKKNNRIDIIESFSGFKKIKYIFKRLFAINNVKVLPEAKY